MIFPSQLLNLFYCTYVFHNCSLIFAASDTEHSFLLTATYSSLKMSSTPIRKRKVLTLADRVNVIKRREKGEKAEVIAKSLEVGVTQIRSIIADKASILQRWENGEPADRKLSKVRKCTYQAVNDKVYEFFLQCRKQNVPVSGVLLKEKATLIAAELGDYDDFSASNGWLEKFKTR